MFNLCVWLNLTSSHCQHSKTSGNDSANFFPPWYTMLHCSILVNLSLSLSKYYRHLTTIIDSITDFIKLTKYYVYDYYFSPHIWPFSMHIIKVSGSRAKCGSYRLLNLNRLASFSYLPYQ